MLIVPIAALLYTYSRSGMISFAISIFIFIAFYNFRYIPLLLIFAVAIVPFLPHTIINRLLTIGNMNDSSNGYRLFIWDGTINMLKQFWFTGIGIGTKAFTKIYPNFAVNIASAAPHSHMLFMQIFVEMGALGIVSFLIFWIGQIKGLIKSFIENKANRELKNFTIASLSSLIGIIFVSSVEYVWFYPRVMIAFFIVFALSSVCVKLSNNQIIE